jgi:hypothetical protein
MKDNQRKMILDWMRKIHQLEYAHRFESLKWSRIHNVVGYTMFGLSTIIAFSYRMPPLPIKYTEFIPYIYCATNYRPPLANIKQTRLIKISRK